MQRKIYKMNKAGSIKRLEFQEDQLIEPSENEVQIAVSAIGLNFADIFAMTGLYSAAPDGPFIPGLEFSGIVIGIGSEVKRFKINDRVMGVIRFGAYATHLNIEENYVFPLPAEWTFEEGAAFLVNGLTAYYALVTLGDLKKGQKVLIHSAAGGVGHLAHRICKKYSAITVGTIGNSSKKKLLEKERFDEIIIRSKSFDRDLRVTAKEKPFDLVLESIGGKIFKISYRLLAPQGRMITYGASNFTPNFHRPDFLKLIFKYFSRPKVDPLEMISSNKSVMGFNLIWLWQNKEEINNGVSDLINMKIGPPVIGGSFDFGKLPEAVKTLQSGQTVGKIVVNT